LQLHSLKYQARDGNITGTTGAVADVVKKYLALRMNLSYFSIMNSPYSYMSPAEKEKYLENAEAALTGPTLLELPKAPAETEVRAIPSIARAL